MLNISPEDSNVHPRLRTLREHRVSPTAKNSGCYLWHSQVALCWNHPRKEVYEDKDLPQPQQDAHEPTALCPHILKVARMCCFGSIEGRASYSVLQASAHPHLGAHRGAQPVGVLSLVPIKGPHAQPVCRKRIYTTTTLSTASVTLT